jgi:hypothetical protein
MGDFNTQPHQLGYSLVTKLGGLLDTYATLHPQLIADEAEKERATTYSVQNPYVKNKISERLDYIFIRNTTNAKNTKNTKILKPLQAKVIFKERLNSAANSGALAYSDHYGVTATLTLEKPATIVDVAVQPDATEQSIENEKENKDEKIRILKEFQTLLQAELEVAQARKKLHQKHSRLSWFVTAIASLMFMGKPKPKGHHLSLIGVSKVISKQTLTIFVTIYALAQSWLAGVVVADEINALTAISSAVKVEIETELSI